MDENELKAKVKEALEKRMPGYGRVKEFYLDIAELADSSVESVANWAKGRNAPAAHNLINLFEKLEGFKAEIMGPESKHAPDVSLGDLRELSDRMKANAAAIDRMLKPSVAEVPVKGKIS